MSDKIVLTPYHPAVKRIAMRNGARLLIEYLAVFILAGFGMWHWAFLVLAFTFTEHMIAATWARHLIELDAREGRMI